VNCQKVRHIAKHIKEELIKEIHEAAAPGKVNTL
jgi:hypothetical protein